VKVHLVRFLPINAARHKRKQCGRLGSSRGHHGRLRSDLGTGLSLAAPVYRIPTVTRWF